jgi:hypothetical protein
MIQKKENYAFLEHNYAQSIILHLYLSMLTEELMLIKKLRLFVFKIKIETLGLCITWFDDSTVYPDYNERLGP